MSKKELRAIALYLPQFHPIPENDAWWGKGFTEWTNVSKAQPLFKGHYQPHLPADLGFYDLRLSEVREAQAALAREYGIYGFCYYHYWFNGKQILERPFREVFESGQPDFPFMLCWANETWTRAWDGQSSEILIGQTYSPEDDRKHIQALIPYFKDKRYIRVNDKPVFAIYRSFDLPDMTATIKLWREEALKHGIELYICRFESCLVSGALHFKHGFDAAIDFQPWSREMNLYREQIFREKQRSFAVRLQNYYYRNLIRRISEDKYDQFRTDFKKKALNGHQYDYGDYVNFVISCPKADYKVYPGITVMWDNTARRKSTPVIFKNATPDLYKKWLTNIYNTFEPFSREENFVFINAWNEWGEGNHLEPCQKWGRSYLEATKAVLVNNHF